jgi:hypothetical protein
MKYNFHKKFNHAKRKILIYFLDKPHFSWFFFFLYSCFILAIILALILNSIIPNIEFSTAQYLLSSLIQSQAAIISIVITITFVMIQIYSSKYSFRISDIMKEYPATWYLMFFFLLSIALDSLCLVLLKNNYIPNLFIYFCFISSILLCFSLIFYSKFILYFLKTETIVALFIKKISNSYTEETDRENLEAIFNVINTSITQSELILFNSSIIQLNEKIIEIIKENDKREGDIQVLFIVSDYVSKLGRLFKNIKNFPMDWHINYILCLKNLLGTLSTPLRKNFYYKPILDILYEMENEHNELLNAMVEGILIKPLLEEKEIPEYIKNTLTGISEKY